MNDIFKKWAAKTDNNKLVIVNLAKDQKLNLEKKFLMPLVQFNNGLFILQRHRILYLHKRIKRKDE